MRYIRMTPEIIEQVLAQMRTELEGQRALKTTQINIPNKIMTPLKNKVIINFTAQAWLKMTTLIAKHDVECAWHGVVHVNNSERTNFTISNIIVYPQTVTGATVTSDEVEYFSWKNNLDDDTYNHLRMQGHSHVNMATTPSGVDTALYDGTLQGMEDFYIFMICNKKGDHWCEIYDIVNNIIYETDDIQWRIQGLNLNKFIEESKNMIKKETFQQKQKAQAEIYKGNNYYGRYGYGGIYGLE